MGGSIRRSSSFRLPAGANPIDPNAWRPLPAQPGSRGQVAGGPSGIVSLLDSNPGGAGVLYAQRLENGVWSPRVTILRDNGLLYGTALDQDASSRLHAVWTGDTDRAGDAVFYATSADGETLWSAPAVVAPTASRLADLSIDFDAGGRGAATVGRIGDDPVQLLWIDPSRVPAATVRIGDSIVQASAACADARDARVRLRACRGGREVAIGSVLRGATFSSATAVRRTRGRFFARFRIARQRTSARVRVRLRPRADGERPRTLTVRALTCRGRM